MKRKKKLGINIGVNVQKSPETSLKPPLVQWCVKVFMEPMFSGHKSLQIQMKLLHLDFVILVVKTFSSVDLFPQRGTDAPALMLMTDNRPLSAVTYVDSPAPSQHAVKLTWRGQGVIFYGISQWELPVKWSTCAWFFSFDSLGLFHCSASEVSISTDVNEMSYI